MTRKQIDVMRETRLWIGQIVVPALVLVTAMSPEAKANIKNSVSNSISKVKTKFRKLKEL